MVLLSEEDHQRLIALAGGSRWRQQEPEDAAFELVQQALRGSWRPTPPPLVLSEGELARLILRLRLTGEVGLLAHRLGDHLDPDSFLGRLLVEHIRTRALINVRGWNHALSLLAKLRAAGVETIVVKGWSSARYYPAGLRPLGDLDLCVAPGDFARAEQIVATYSGKIFVDLKSGCPLLGGCGFDELLVRSQELQVPGGKVRTLGPEDHLRLLCVHMLRHGAGRPLWCCDLAAALEALPEQFDWNLCLRGSGLERDHVLTAIALAHVLLGASLEGVPAAAKEHCARLPAWLLNEIRRQWVNGVDPMGVDFLPLALWKLRRRPVAMLREIGLRWRNPVVATAILGVPFNWWPRFPVQVAYMCWLAYDGPRRGFALHRRRRER